LLENPALVLKDRRPDLTPIPRWNPELFATVAPQMEPGEVPHWNRANYLRLLDFQRAEDEGCYFFGVYGLSAALFPQRALPSAETFLKSIRPMYHNWLYKDTLLTRHYRGEPALAIYPEWGIQLSRLAVDSEGEKIIGRHLSSRVPKLIVPQLPLLERLNPELPYSVLVHQPGGNNSHYITMDGTPEAEQVFGEYALEGFRVVSILEFVSGISRINEMGGVRTYPSRRSG